MEKNKVKVLAAVAVAMMFFAGCSYPDDTPDGDNNSSGGGGNSSPSGGNSSSSGGGVGSSRENPKSVTVGYSDSHSISLNGEYWFKFVGDGNPVIFETEGNVVDTYIYNETTWNGDDDSGEGSNALLSFNTTSGTTYYIRITPRNNTSGTYTLVVKAPTINIRTNSISVTTGNSSSHTISSGNQHWFSFQGTGNSVIFETESNVVTTNIELYIGDNTSTFLTDNKRISFSTVLGTTYYIKVTGNSGTYTFNVNNGAGDGSSKSYAIPIAVGNSSSHSISLGGEHWFSFLGTGETVIFETEGNVVDTYIYNETTWNGDDDSGEGSNALLSFNTTSGTTYYIRITPRNNTSGTYTLVVR